MHNPRRRARWSGPDRLILLLHFGLVFLLLLIPDVVPGVCYDPSLEGCVKNLKDIAAALSIYGSDHKGAYPPALSALVPSYFEKLPECPSAGRDTYTPSYRGVPSGSDAAQVTLFCRGEFHRACSNAANSPRFDGGRCILPAPSATARDQGEF
ncbi:MAG: hypothetical protein HYU64_18420 [Armatimonadetes bacterium]|nr:hypothetical protein [Armatimonadota bacterium]